MAPTTTPMGWWSIDDDRLDATEDHAGLSGDEEEQEDPDVAV